MVSTAKSSFRSKKLLRSGCSSRSRRSSITSNSSHIDLLSSLSTLDISNNNSGNLNLEKPRCDDNSSHKDGSSFLSADYYEMDQVGKMQILDDMIHVRSSTSVTVAVVDENDGNSNNNNNNCNNRYRPTLLRRSNGTKKINNMFLRIYKSSRNKSKSRQPSVDKTVSSCCEEEEFEFSARTLQSVQDDYMVDNNSPPSSSSSSSQPIPMRGLSMIRHPQQDPTTTTTFSSSNGRRQSSVPNLKTHSNTVDSSLLETIDEKFKLGDDIDDHPRDRLQSLSSLPTNLSSTSLAKKRKNRLRLKMARSLTSHLDDAKFIRFLYKDPRWKLMQYHDEVIKQFSTISEQQQQLLPEEEQQQLDMFSVWRLTSNDAIKKMMKGEATGKGLDIKGKSARTGLLSGYVPFLQIHSNDQHKYQIATLPKDASIRIFFKTKEQRTKAIQILQPILEEMIQTYEESNQLIQASNHNSSHPEVDDEVLKKALSHLSWEMSTPSIQNLIDTKEYYGMDLPERLFWEAFVIRKDITRTAGSLNDTGRPSEPAFQDMNFAATRASAANHNNSSHARRAVVFQHGGLSDSDDPLCPTSLLMAYQENGRIMPVSSDFDMLLAGTKGLVFESSMAPEQVKLQQKLISNIELILEDKDSSNRSWTSNWLAVLKKTTKQVYEVPTLGFGDPTSCFLVKQAVCTTASTGAVRHGAECFNYSFPQELDKKFLVISRKWNGIMPWRYLTLSGLQDYLLEKVEQGFVFPLNPKWILCDPGWKRIYDALMHPTTNNNDWKKSLDVWYPPNCGIRERMEQVHSKYPHGFQQKSTFMEEDCGDTSAMDLAELELKRYLTLQRAKRKLLFIIRLNNMMKETRRKRSERDNNKEVDN